MKAEREQCVLVINQLNKSHKHLHPDPVEWEYDIVKGNVPGYATVQKALNPKLQESDIALFIFYSRLAEHPNIASTYNNLGEVYRSKQDYDTAIEYYRLSLNMYEKFLPPGHLYIHVSKENSHRAQMAKDVL